MSNDRAELEIQLPWDVLDACNGFSFDIGGSVMKVAYIHKDDWKEKDERSSENGTLRLANFSRSEIPQAYPYVLERAYIKRTPKDKTFIYMTGVGGAQYMEELCKKFDITTEIITEMDAFVQAFVYTLKNVPSTDLVTGIPDGVLQTIEMKHDMWMNWMETLKKQCNSAMSVPRSLECEITLGKDMPNGSSFMEDKDIFPATIVMCGSAGVVMKVEEDGAFHITDMIRACGRLFLGLGCMLTGAKDYPELMELAEKGNGNNVHQTWGDIQEGINKDDDSMYSAGKELDSAIDFPMFFFGKGVGKKLDEFKPEDVANALLKFMVVDLVQVAHHCSKEHPTQHVFFCGNYVAHPLMQKMIAEEWGERDAGFAVVSGGKMKSLHFLKYGAFYGALGSLLNHKLKYTDRMAELQEKSSHNIDKFYKNKAKSQ